MCLFFPQERTKTKRTAAQQDKIDKIKAISQGKFTAFFAFPCSESRVITRVMYVVYYPVPSLEAWLIGSSSYDLDSFCFSQVFSGLGIALDCSWAS